MSEATRPSARTGKELFEATRPFAVEWPARSWWCVGSTFFALVAVLMIAGLVSWWPLRLSASLLGALFFVRAFILYHDFLHGSLLRGSRLAQPFFYAFGMAVLTPPRIWRRSHNIHHAKVGRTIASNEDGFSLVTSDIGSFPLMTTHMWRQASARQRLSYRVRRHPLTILCAYATVFLVSLCLAPLVRNPRKNWEGLFSLLTHCGLVALLWYGIGPAALFFAFLLPFAIASALGAYLFFAQHNFDGMQVLPADEWTHYRGSLESSSSMKTGLIMQWFTGNIGYHDIHHLNALIPFYRLPETMAAIPELQLPMDTSLRPRDVLACLRLNLWSPEKRLLVSFRDAANPRLPNG